MDIDDKQVVAADPNGDTRNPLEPTVSSDLQDDYPEDELKTTKDELERSLSEEEKLREILKNERDRINAIINSMGEGLLVVSADYNIEIINPTAERLLGVKAQEVIGKPWHEITKAFVGEKEIPFEDRMSINVLKAGSTVVTELGDDHYYESIGGKRFPVTSITTPIVRNGQVVGSVKVFKDATKEKEQQSLIEETVKKRTTQLKEEQGRVSSILENATEGIVLTNEKGLIDYVNPAFLRMTNYTSEDLEDNKFSSIIRTYNLKNKPISPDELLESSDNTSDHESKYLLERKDGGEKLAVLVSSARIKVEEQFKGVVMIFHDFTEELNLQKQKDNFFSIASHELRTPLTIIAGNIDTVLTGYGESKLSGHDQQTLGDSLEATERLIKMVNDFLNVSRLDQGRLKVDRSALNSCQITKEVIAELKPLAENKGLYLNYNCDQFHLPVLADEGLLREVLINLIGNAIKFTENGGITVDHKTGDKVMSIKVSDTGMGIEEKRQGQLFHRFQQAMGKALSREAGGTGLGLYISKEFTEAMKGELVLEKSEAGKGSTFKLSLPLVEQAGNRESH